MKNFLTLVLSLLLLTGTVKAQKIYFRGGVGYALPQGGQIYGFGGYPLSGKYSANYTGNDPVETFDVKKSSFSAGVHGVVAAGMLLTKHIGVELGADIGLATKKMTLEVLQVDPGSSSKQTITQQSKLPIFVMPALVIQSGGKINVYARGAVVIPVKSKISSDISATETYATGGGSVTEVTNVSITHTASMTPGFGGAMGVKIKPAKHIAVWGEVNMTSLTLHFKESELTKYYIDGEDVLPYLTPEQKTIKYKLKGTSTGTTNVQMSESIPYSNIGVNVGISFEL